MWSLLVGAGTSVAKDLAAKHGTRILTDAAFRNDLVDRAGGLLASAGRLRGAKQRKAGDELAAAPEVDPLVVVLEALATLPTRDDLAAALLAVRTDVDRKLRIAIGLAAAGLLTGLIGLAILCTR